MTHRQQTIANELCDARASRAIASRHAEEHDLRALFLDAQARTSRLLAHGAADADELRTLARMCDVPAHVLRADMIVEVR